MRALHLKQTGGNWQYQRRVPKKYRDIEKKSLIRFSLKTRDFQEAKILAARQTQHFDKIWADAQERGVSLATQDSQIRYTAAMAVTRDLRLDNLPAAEISDEQLLTRLRLLILGEKSVGEQQAVLGLVPVAALSLGQAFERFWDHVRDEWMEQSQDQRRGKRNVYLKAIRNFEKAVGAVPLHTIERKHALGFRAWWLARIQNEGLKPYTANREINSLRRLVTVNFDIDGIERQNPFHRVRLKDTQERQRQPFATPFLRGELLRPGALDGLKPPLRALVKMMINTGARPSEILGLERADFNLDAEIPHIHIRSNKTHALKTLHSERQIPLVGVSLAAAREIAADGGWGKWAGKNMYATSVVNKWFRESNLVPDKNQSLYSLRHWFQDQLTKNDVVDRAQAQLMGHKFQRPKYGFGKDLAELREIIEKFAL